MWSGFPRSLFQPCMVDENILAVRPWKPLERAPKRGGVAKGSDQIGRMGEPAWLRIDLERDVDAVPRAGHLDAGCY